MSELEIHGSVAKILNTTQVVINRGTKDGVKIGMIFEILDKNATKIVDPESGKMLGSIDRPKVQVKVVIIEENLSIAETFRKKTVNRGGVGTGLGAMSSMFSAPDYVDVRETFKATEKAWEDLPEERSYVKVGDPVQLVSTTQIMDWS